MSRRHKEKETEIQQPRRMESQGDGHQGDLSDNSSTIVSSYIGAKIRFTTSINLGSICEDALHIALYRTFSLIDDISVKLHLNNHYFDYSFNEVPDYLKNEYKCDVLNKIVKEVAEEVEDVENESKRGRPEIKQLSSYVDDKDVCSWAKNIYKRIYHKSISVAKDLTQYFVCFICSFFKIFKTESADGRIAHFRRMMLPHVKSMPTARALQKYYAWFAYWKAAAIKTAKELKDEAKYYAWKGLEELIHGHLVQLSVQVVL